jgi:hypothetical protein
MVLLTATEIAFAEPELAQECSGLLRSEPPPVEQMLRHLTLALGPAHGLILP